MFEEGVYFYFLLLILFCKGDINRFLTDEHKGEYMDPKLEVEGGIMISDYR